MRKIVVVGLLLLSLATYGYATCFLDFLTESLPDFQRNSTVNFQIQVCCGTPAYTFTLYSGTMPAGLTLSSTGLISGVPTTDIDTTIFVTVTDSAGCHVTEAYRIVVAN